MTERDEKLREKGYRFPDRPTLHYERPRTRPAWLAFLLRILRVG